jgi:4-hydroxybenzoate polyprenyltransferase
MLGVLFTLGYLTGMGIAYQTSIGLVGLLLAYMHLFRKSASLDSMNQDFFLANIAVSACVLAGVAATWLI